MCLGGGGGGGGGGGDYHKTIPDIKGEQSHRTCPFRGETQIKNEPRSIYTDNKKIEYSGSTSIQDKGGF